MYISTTDFKDHASALAYAKMMLGRPLVKRVFCRGNQVKVLYSAYVETMPSASALDSSPRPCYNGSPLKETPQ